LDKKVATINVKTAGFGYGSNPDVLTTLGIGSCIAICLYFEERKIGGLLHIMLPRAESDNSNPYRYADTALIIILADFKNDGISPKQLVAKLVGGAQMFHHEGADETIGERNLDEVINILKVLNIPVVSSAIGGHHGRSLAFELSNGNVIVNEGTGATSHTI
jgi:chemotaxis protein CheD